MNTTPPAPATRSLRDLVSREIDGRWDDWARAHPHLAAAIDRVHLIDTTVTQLRQSPEFREAMKQADLDESRLDAALAIVPVIQRWAARAMGL